MKQKIKQPGTEFNEKVAELTTAGSNLYRQIKIKEGFEPAVGSSNSLDLVP